MISTFEGKINPGDPIWIKLYLKATKEIYKETDNLDVSVSNGEDILDHFIRLDKNMDGGALHSW